jgi:hypothetical protein
MKDLPFINTAYLHHEADQEVTIAVHKRMRKVFATSDMKEVSIGNDDEKETKSQAEID